MASEYDSRYLEDLSGSDRSKISGFPDVSRPEPDQIIPPSTELPKPAVDAPGKRATAARDRARDLLGRMDALKEKVDKRCGHLIAKTGEPRGSALQMAMWRVFGVETSDVTYAHYKAAIEQRQQLAEEDAAEKKGR